MIKVIKNGTVITMNKKREIIKKADVVIRDDKIIDIISKYNGEYNEVIDASGKIVMPGLINCHTHLGMSIFRNTNDGLDLMHWLKDKVWPIEEQMSNDDIYYANMLSCAEAIKTGSTTLCDMYFGISGLEAIKKSKVRCSYTRTLIDDEDNCKGKIKELEELINNNNNSDLITFTIAPHSLYTCSDELLKKCKVLSDKYNLPIHVHFCENKDEVSTIENKFNMKAVNVLEKYGFLDNKLLLAHGVVIEDENLSKLSRDNITIIHNIVSNLNLGCGIAPIKKYLDNNINIALGTDGDGSALSLDMFNTMSFTSLIYKGINFDPKFSSYKILEMATINGAKALGLDDKIGSIEVNKQADIIILDLENNIEQYPINNLLNEIVHNIKPYNIIHSIINGEIVMKDRKLIYIDEIELKNKVLEIINNLNLKGDIDG